MSDPRTGTCSFCHGQHPVEECEELVEFERYEEELEARIDFLDREDYQGLVN